MGRMWTKAVKGLGLIDLNSVFFVCVRIRLKKS